jgi:putative redox protein
MDSRPADEPVAGASPMELVLQAAGGCSGMDVVLVLKKRRLELEKFEMRIEGVKRDEHPRIYESIHITYRAKGIGITVEELERAAELSLKTFCSVFGMLKLAAKVTHSCELMD